jgi:Secretion system C-terminal sorting domain
MKKLYAFLLASMLVAGVSAQSIEITGAQTKTLYPAPVGLNKTNVADTITDYLDRATAFYILTAGSSGYVLGTSDVTGETGQHYDGVGNALVNEAMVYFVHKEIMGSPDNITCKVYAVGADSFPTTLMGSGTVSSADADTTGFPTFVALNNTTYSTNGFLVSVEYGNIDDTVALFSSNPTTGSGGPDGAGEERCRQFVTTLAGWATAADVWTIGGSAFNADALIIPIVDISGGAAVNPVTTSEFALKGAYPNPAYDMTTIGYSLESARNIRVVIFDHLGRIVGEMPSTLKAAGNHEIVVNLSNYAAGKYYYTVYSDNTSLTSKFVVVK